MEIPLRGARIRSFRSEDAAPLARHADSLAVWRQLRDRFPHPYRVEDAERFLASVVGKEPETDFAVEVEGEAAGAIGLTLGIDVERVSAEIGYWLAEAHWGRGIATQAVAEFTAWGIERYGLTRVFARVFDGNAASIRVLEKAGYRLEGRLRRAAIKEGRLLDQLQYAFVSAPRVVLER
jgi:[ribosomal protein S5]-alanine N-acetyltransferase